MRTHAFGGGFAALLLLGGALLGAPAVADDGGAKPAGPPAPLPKVASPFLDGLVGSWDVVVKAQGKELKGVETFAKAVDGTALRQELHVGEGPTAFDGLGVMRVAADGKTLSYWWYDSMGRGEVWKFAGTLTADGYELTSEERGMKTVKGLRKDGEALAYSMTVGGQPMVTGKWTKAAKPVAVPEPKGGALSEHPLVKAELGDWIIKATSMGGEYEGKARFRLAVGGHYLAQDYEIHGGEERHAGFGVSSLSSDGKTLRSWWFGNFASDPLAMSGAVTEKGWSATTKHPLAGEMTVTFTKTEAGFEAVYSAGGTEMMQETYSRPK